MSEPVVDEPTVAVAVAEVAAPAEAVDESHEILEAVQSHDIGELHGMVTQIAERLGGIDARLTYVEETARAAEETAENAEEIAEQAEEIAVVATVEAIEAEETAEIAAEIAVSDGETVAEVETVEVEEPVTEPAKRSRRRPYGKRR